MPCLLNAKSRILSGESAYYSGLQMTYDGKRYGSDPGRQWRERPQDHLGRYSRSRYRTASSRSGVPGI